MCCAVKTLHMFSHAAENDLLEERSEIQVVKVLELKHLEVE